MVEQHCFKQIESTVGQKIPISNDSLNTSISIRVPATERHAFDVAMPQDCGSLSPEKLLLVIYTEAIRRFSGQASATVLSRDERAELLLCRTERQWNSCEAVQRLAGAESPEAPADGYWSQNTGEAVPPTWWQQGLVCRWELHGEKFRLHLECKVSSWPARCLVRFAEACQQLTTAAATAPLAELSSFAITNERDGAHLREWNATQAAYAQLSADQLFEQQSQIFPAKTAITFAGRSLTYAELSSRVNALALRLRSAGVQRGSVIGIYMDRSIEMVVGMLATMKAGGAYLPIDPSLPFDRIDYMLADARPQVILTQAHLTAALPTHSRHLMIVPATAENGSHEICPSYAQPDGLAYLLYTSGSTGKPKGVQIRHRSLSNLLFATVERLNLNSSDVFVATATISFDISVFEIFGPMCMGAQLVVASRADATDGRQLAGLAQTHQATVLQATPSGWRLLLESGWTAPPRLKLLSCGEPMDRALADRLLESGSELWNLYGPTETTVYSHAARITWDSGPITVGDLLGNYTGYVLDAQRKQVPVGAIGELYIGGAGVAAGYLNRAELSAERFASIAGCEAAGEVLYRTGDLARYLPNGETEILGRVDNQVKIRGYRIELEEVEAAMSAVPGVKKAVAAVQQVESGDQRLVAFLAVEGGDRFDEAKLKAQLARTLPSYMVPARCYAVQVFPLNGSGKIDRKALLAQGSEKAQTRRPNPDSETEACPVEAKVLDCWRTILSNPELGLDDDFFSAGGHSLLAVRMIVQLSQEFDIKLSISLMVNGSTARTLAKQVSKLKTSVTPCLVLLQEQGSLPPLYLVHHLMGDVLIYRWLAERLAPERPVVGIQVPSNLLERSQRVSFEELATEYVSEILSQHPGGPVHLAGFSTGSVLAYEIARQLQQQGCEVGLVALLDGENAAGMAEVSTLRLYTSALVRKIAKIVFKFKEEAAKSPTEMIGKRLFHLRLMWQLKRLENRLDSSSRDLSVEQVLALAERAYRPQPYPGKALLVRFHDEAWRYGPDPLMGWGRVVEGKLAVKDVPGNHLTGMGPGLAKGLASMLNSQMKRLEGSASFSQLSVSKEYSPSYAVSPGKALEPVA